MVHSWVLHRWIPRVVTYISKYSNYFWIGLQSVILFGKLAASIHHLLDGTPLLAEWSLSICSALLLVPANSENAQLPSSLVYKNKYAMFTEVCQGLFTTVLLYMCVTQPFSSFLLFPICGDLNRNGSHRFIYLNFWSLEIGVTWQWIGDVAIME